MKVQLTAPNAASSSTLPLTNEQNVYVSNVAPTAAGKYVVEASLDGKLIGADRREVIIADRLPSALHTLITPEKVSCVLLFFFPRIFFNMSFLVINSHCMLVRKTVWCWFSFAMQKKNHLLLVCLLISIESAFM